MILEQSQFDLEGLVSNDDLFQDDPVLAYASAWLNSFYLSEKFPPSMNNSCEPSFEKFPFGESPVRSDEMTGRQSLGSHPIFLKNGFWTFMIT